jgi:hypothetical protein
MNMTLFAALALVLSTMTTSVEAAPFTPSPALEPAPMVTLTGSRVASTILVSSERNQEDEDDLASPDGYGYTADDTGGGY